MKQTNTLYRYILLLVWPIKIGDGERSVVYKQSTDTNENGKTQMRTLALSFKICWPHLTMVVNTELNVLFFYCAGASFFGIGQKNVLNFHHPWKSLT